MQYLVKISAVYCAADIRDVVQRGLGMLPQQAIFENGTKGEIEKISEPVQVYTACYNMFDPRMAPQR